MKFPKFMRANYRMFRWMLFWQAGFSVLGVVMVLVINAVINDEPTYACLGTLLALFGLIGCVFVYALTNLRFHLAVSMGQTRRAYLVYTPLLVALASAQGCVTARCLYWLEGVLYSLLYPGYVNDLPLDMIFQDWAFVLAVVIPSVAALFFGAVESRFGQKGLGVIWALIWGSCMVVPRALDQAIEGRTSILARFGGVLLTAAGALSPVMWCALGVLAALGAVAFSVRVYLRAEVRL